MSQNVTYLLCFVLIAFLILILIFYMILGLNVFLSLGISLGILLVAGLAIYFFIEKYEGSRGIKHSVGSVEAKVMICPVCNIKIESGVQTCPQCGKKI